MNDFMFINEFKNSYACSSSKQTDSVSLPISRHHRKTSMIWKHKKVPRPRNAFMLYLQNVRSNIITKNQNLHNKEISRIAGELWNKETDEVQKYFERKADEEKLYHSLAHPGYKYCPQQKRRNYVSSHHEGVKETICQASKNSEETTTKTYQNQDILANSPPSQCLDATIIQAFFDDHTTYALYYDSAY